MSRAVIDTSVLIAREQARPLERALPDEVAVSVVSIAELEVGVLVARDAATRARRLRALTELRSLAGALPIDERVASAYAQLAAVVLSGGRRPRIHADAGSGPGGGPLPRRGNRERNLAGQIRSTEF